MSDDVLWIERDDRGVVSVTLNRPDIHNAFDDVLIARLAETFRSLGSDPSVRVVLLMGNGKSFSAGADLGWMRRMADYSPAENEADARALAGMLRAIRDCPKPTVAFVHGAAFGGGVGLVAACDIAIATEKALFCLSEVRLGLIPAAIGPHVVAAMGARAARRYFLTAERFGAATALHLGLVHKVVEEGELSAARDEILKALLAGGPVAQGAAKELIFAIADRPLDDALEADTARRIATLRAGAEGREGLAAFLEKRPAAWTEPS